MSETVSASSGSGSGSDNDVDGPAAPIWTASSPRATSFNDDDVYAERLKRESFRNKLRRWFVSGIVLAAGIACIFAGAAEMMAAERERQHGWMLQQCTVTYDFAHNDTECIYFGVHVPDGKELCAVPAAIASASSFLDPPACHGTGSRASDSDIAYWSQVAVNATVSCLVPTRDTSAVALTACVAATTGGRNVASIVWRTWIERLVYLVRTPREGASAIEAISTIRIRTGAILLFVGLVVVVLTLLCVCYCCAPPALMKAQRRHRARRMAAHKVY